jgi:peroxiredoxin
MLSPHSQEPPSPKPLRVGDRAPDFTLKFLNSDQTFTLSHNFGKKPTVLIFGSYT